MLKKLKRFIVAFTQAYQKLETENKLYNPQKDLHEQRPGLYLFWFLFAIVGYAFLFWFLSPGDLKNHVLISTKDVVSAPFYLVVELLVSWEFIEPDSNPVLPVALVRGPGDEHVLSFLDFLYFSIVTITTLGYGEMTPENGVARFIVGMESVTGILITGMFLNSLSQKTSQKSQVKERKEISSLIEDRVNALMGEITGGNSFPRVFIKPPRNEDGFASFDYAAEGDYPLHFVVVEVKDEFTGKILVNKELGTLIPQMGLPGDNFSVDYEGQISLQVNFYARNGLWTQNIRLEKRKNKWIKAEKVVAKNKNKDVLIYEEIDFSFPRPDGGAVAWGENHYIRVYFEGRNSGI